MPALRSQPAPGSPLWRLDSDVGRSPDLRRLQPAPQAVRSFLSSPLADLLLLPFRSRSKKLTTLDF